MPLHSKSQKDIRAIVKILFLFNILLSSNNVLFYFCLLNFLRSKANYW